MLCKGFLAVAHELLVIREKSRRRCGERLRRQGALV